MAYTVEVEKIEADHQANMQKAKENLDYTVAKAKRDYESLVADYEAMREARLEALVS